MEFLECLQKYKIGILIDVRTYPYSRYCPQFRQFELKQMCFQNNIEYIWKGKNLGGKKENINYQGTIDELVAMANHKTICLVCSEKDYKKCHRHSLITPSLEKQDIIVKHID